MNKPEFPVRILHIFPILFFVIIIFELSGCEDTGSVGIDLTDEEPTDIVAIDTLSINSSTVFMDSVVTQGSGTILSGTYNDDYLGRVNAKGYLSLALRESFTVEDEARYDSLTLRMNQSYYYGNADQPQQFFVHRVNEDIEPVESDDNIHLYNFDSFDYDQEVLGQTTFTPDDVDEEIEIRMSDELGRTLFEAAKSGDDIVTDSEEFLDFFKGLVLIGDAEGGSAVSGFDADSTGDISMRLYYSEPEEQFYEERYYDFNATQGMSFSQVRGDRMPPLDQLTLPNDTISSSETDNLLYMQSGVGLMTRLDFPTINNLFQVSSDFVLNSATLYLRPIPGTYESEVTPLPEPLTVYVADIRNRIVGALTFGGGNMNVYPTVDKEFDHEAYYKFNITNYVHDVLYTDRYTGRGLLIAPAASSSYRSSVDRLVFGDAENREYKMFLQIVLTEID